MRVSGRVPQPNGSLQWVVVETAANGDNSQVYLTALAQALKLNLNESPFYGDWGIPAHSSVVQQIPPDYNIMLTQQRFAPYFASLIISRISSNPPTYQVNVTTNYGAVLSYTIAT